MYVIYGYSYDGLMTVLNVFAVVSVVVAFGVAAYAIREWA